MILLSLALAAQPLYRECSVSIGEIQTCSATAYTGITPIEQNGHVYDSDVSIGVVWTANEPYTGTMPLVRGGKVVSCQVQQGNISQCLATGFTGMAILLR